jgi:hypothetical protein
MYFTRARRAPRLRPHAPGDPARAARVPRPPAVVRAREVAPESAEEFLPQVGGGYCFETAARTGGGVSEMSKAIAPWLAFEPDCLAAADGAPAQPQRRRKGLGC